MHARTTHVSLPSLHNFQRSLFPRPFQQKKNATQLILLSLFFFGFIKRKKGRIYGRISTQGVPYPGLHPTTTVYDRSYYGRSSIRVPQNICMYAPPNPQSWKKKVQYTDKIVQSISPANGITGQEHKQYFWDVSLSFLVQYRAYMLLSYRGVRW